MTTQAPQRQRKPAPPPTPRAVMVVSAIGLTFAVTGVAYLAYSFGFGKSAVPPCIAIGLGLALTVLALTSWFQRLFERRAVIYQADDVRPAPASAKKPAPAGKPSKIKDRKTKSVLPPVPTLKPARNLGAEFGFILLASRAVITSGREDVLAVLTEFWNSGEHLWEMDLDPDEMTDYRWSVERVFDLVRDDPAYNEQPAIPDDPSNPFTFLSELERYSPVMNAVGALMLVRAHDDVTAEMTEAIMEPWTTVGLPYRFLNTIYEATPDGSDYKARQLRPRGQQAPQPGDTMAPPVVDGTRPVRGTLAESMAEIADRVSTAQAAPAPQPSPEPPAQPTPQPTAAAQPAAAEDQVPDDVARPTAEQLVHAAELVVDSQFGSVHMVGRKLRVPFLMSIKIMQKLHAYGVVGPNKDDGIRDVLADAAELPEIIEAIKEFEPDDN